MTTTWWFHGTDRGVPIITITEEPPSPPSAVREATDDEVLAYEAFYNRICNRCGREYGDHLDSEIAEHFPDDDELK